MSVAMSAYAVDETIATASDAAPVGELVITAQKHASTVQKTPVSITAVSGDDLQDRGVPSLAALAQGTPGVSLKSEGPSQTEIEMRGMTSSGGNSATVGFYIDDLPLSGPASAQNGHVIIDPDLYDLNRVEMLRGPQGTLFGSGSMGGTVRLITNQPDPTGYHASAESILSGTEGGSFNHGDNIMVNVPLVQDKLTLRVVGSENYTSGWIDRIVANPFPTVTSNGTVRGDVAGAPVEKDYPGSNAYQTYSARATLLWTPTENLSITPSFFYSNSTQNDPSVYDSVSATNAAPAGGLAHYQAFDIAQPLTDKLLAYSLKVNYTTPWFDVTSSTAYWSRISQQTEEATDAFNNPDTGVTLYANYGAGNPGQGYYGPNGSGPEYGTERDPSSQFSEELRFNSNDNGRLTWVGGLYFSHFNSTWTFAGTTPNYTSFMDLGSGLPATTPNWFDAYEPTHNSQYAAFGDAAYDVTDKLKIEIGARVTQFDYNFASCITGWGSALGNATPSCTGLIKLTSDSFNPKFNVSYSFTPDIMAYGTVASGFRPGGGNATYPTTGVVWGAAFAAMNYTTGQWPLTYKPDSVWSYEIGEKARFFDRRLTVNASIYYEDWNNIQLEAYPDDWALNINGNSAKIYGAELEIKAKLGAGFEVQLSGGYVHETLDGGPHWVISPVHTLPEVPPESGTAVISYTKSLSDDYLFTVKLENSYTGKRYSLAFPYPVNAFGAYEPMAAYDLTNIRAGIRSEDGWSVALFVNNVFNKHAQLENLYTENLATAAYNEVVTNQPLTAGVDLSFKF
jgi:outer membrane receptor protein involved in Fe transport